MSGPRFKSLSCGSLCQATLELEGDETIEAVRCDSVPGECAYMIVVIGNSDTDPGYTAMARIKTDTNVLKAFVT